MKKVMDEIYQAFLKERGAFYLYSGITEPGESHKLPLDEIRINNVNISETRESLKKTSKIADILMNTVDYCLKHEEVSESDLETYELITEEVMEIREYKERVDKLPIDL